MGYTPMTEAEIRDFIGALPARTVAAATTRKDGSPHVTPVWVDVDDDGTICLNTGSDSVKGRTLARDGRIALTWHDDEPPFNFVVAEGTVELVDDLEEVTRWATRIGGRYMGAEHAAEYGARNGVPGELLVRVTVTKWIAAKDVAH
jgi:PPOX class probable F420-dependent enzyme